MNDLFDVKNNIADKIFMESYKLGKLMGENKIREVELKKEYINGLKTAKKLVIDLIDEKMMK